MTACSHTMAANEQSLIYACPVTGASLWNRPESAGRRSPGRSTRRSCRCRHRRHTSSRTAGTSPESGTGQTFSASR
eukprot:365739-Chlamydomonas_euryale.AAC.1